MRGGSVIELVHTPHGFSIVENSVQVNKPHHNKPKDKPYSAPKRYTPQTFTIYPYLPTLPTDNHKYIILPARTQWFNLNLVHQIQKKALPEWFKIKKGILATMSNVKFEKNEELYKKYRNHIIQLGRSQHITPTRARKGLAGDACSIIRIHKFLEKWGLINYIHPRNDQIQPRQQHCAPQRRKDGFEKERSLLGRSYGKDDLELLKKITKKYRSVCQFCECITGIVWFEYREKFHVKQLKTVPGEEGQPSYRNVSSGEPFEYDLVICANCLSQGNVPLVLSPEDFIRKTILDSIEFEHSYESDKKRNLEQNKVAESIEKHRFNINRTAQHMKLDPQLVFKILMTMPIQKMEKIARIDPETEPEEEPQAKQAPKSDKKEETQGVRREEVGEVSLEERVRAQVGQLQEEERRLYEGLLQSWLLKISAKMERLGEWQSGVGAKFDSAIRLQQSILADEVQSTLRRFS